MAVLHYDKRAVDAPFPNERHVRNRPFEQTEGRTAAAPSFRVDIIDFALEIIVSDCVQTVSVKFTHDSVIEQT